MSKEEVIKAIDALAKVVQANTCFWGNERLVVDANLKIKELMNLL